MMKDSRGFSLIETLVCVGIVATIAMSLASANFLLRKTASKAASRGEIDLIHQNITNLIAHNSSWDQTVDSDSQMICLTGAHTTTPAHTVCTPSPFAGWPGWLGILFGQPSCTTRPAVTSIVSCNNVGSREKISLTLRDAQGNLIYDAKDRRNGINENGETCGPHARKAQNRNSRYPSSDCPYRFEIAWYATQPANQPMVGVMVDLLTDSRYNKLSLNAHRYSTPTIFRPAR